MARSEALLVLELRASRGFRIGLVVFAAAALAAVPMAELPVSVAAPLGLLAVVASVRAWRSQAALDGLRLRLSADGSLDWRDAEGREGQGRLAAHASVGPLVTLDLRESAGRIRRWAIWRDMLDADAWRRLRVALARTGSADSYKDLT